jgi:transcriptional regulator with XRE-family HTH domain
VNVSGLIKDARLAAGLTQRCLATRAGTTQPAIATYEAGRRTPSLATLRRLLDACDHDLDLSARPRTRRGARSLSAVAATMATDLREENEGDALRLLFGFADDYRGSSRPGKISLMCDEPPTTGARRFDAALAGAAEYFAREAGLAPPAWVDQPSRFVEPWWLVSSAPALDAYVLSHTPATFARHGVFIAREVFDRA